MKETITGSTVAGHYKVTGMLRPGRMGDIYVARRLEDDAKVAIKFLEPALFENEEAIARFERESKVAHAIDHPCTIRVLEFGRSEHGPYLVTEFVEGELLSDVIEDKGALGPERAAVITARIARALQAAHDKGVVHRDLAPSNVILGRQGDRTDLVKVSDFGLALLTHEDEEDSTHLTAVGVRIGTPTYMAPEYIEEYELDHRADIYGLGIMLYEMLTGQPPFTGRPYKVMDAHVNDPIPRPSAKRSEVPKWLDDLVLRMAAKRPDQRPQSSGEVAEAIEKGLGRKVDVFEYRAPTAERAPTRAAVAPSNPPPPAGDPILEHFLAQNAGQVTRTSAPPPPRDRRFLVHRVAAESVAGRLGIGVGWWAHLPDEQQEGLLDPALHHHVVRERRWWFGKDDGGERIELVVSGLPIGVELVAGAENIVQHYDPLIPRTEALLDLWAQRRWDDLERLAWRTVTQTKGQAGLFSRFMGAEKPKLVDHPAVLLHGCAQVELKKAEGLRSIMDFKAKHASKWPAIYGAVADLYLAEAAKRTDPKRAADLVSAAVLQAPDNERLISLYVELFGDAPVTAPWVGRTWSDYSMDSVDRQGEATLSGTLQHMDSAELLGVCMLGGFRSNHDYDEFMHRWAHYSAFFGPFLSGLHIVTATTEVDAPVEHRGEAVCRAAGLPIAVLHDYRAFVQRAVKPAAIPTVYLLDQTGTCVHEGRLTPCDLWEALELAGRLRTERFQGGAR
ncbi:MAG: serine/threonine protein kinase [Alphaproteobacteria bacterium]|nr:serine/threonine protein kinase [Alphaproteobacteria bacterium]